jgi:peptidoglycan hydrolase-like protein with peptidoglycan-binding domain/3D (Asp-Asp-Asp) domain-containing protein
MARFFQIQKVNRKTKKIVVGLVLALQFALMLPATADESIPMQARKLLVTAYYSPLPNQTFYIRGSYEADIRLNGRGTNGADGTQVYTGMLAAPKTYPFGTRVKIPGLGVGEVHDRGGAILAGKDYDRIDVWMGSGEEGLSRALNWGARVVDGEIYYTPDQIEPGFSFSGISATLPDAFVNRLKNNSVASTTEVASTETSDTKTDVEVQPVTEPVAPAVTDEENKELERLEQNRTLLAAGIGKDDNGDEVKNLQRMLWDLGYYQGEITGTYDQVTVDAVFSFQVESGVLKTEWDSGAGYFGKKTLEALLSVIEKKIQVLANYPKEVQVWVPAKQVLPEIAVLQVPEVVVERQALVFSEDIVNKKVVQQTRLNAELNLDDQSDDVTKLQNFLIERGYLAAGLNTGFYGPQTEAAVLKFQLEQGVIDGANAQGAGRVGPQTLAAINSI